MPIGIHIPKETKVKQLEYIRANLNKMSLRAIARNLKIGKTAINRWAKEIGYKHIRHTANENYFDNWTNEMAYILGFIYADGNVAWNTTKGYYSMTITAAAKDKGHLEKIREKLQSTKPLLYAQSTNSYRLIINSKKLCKRLMQLGVVPTKSLILEFPDIPKEYLSDFLRGVIDGDGWERYNDRKRSPYFEIGIASGSKQFCEKLITTINKEIGITTKIVKPNTTHTLVMRYTCQRGETLANYIYQNATMFLERKHIAFEKAKERRKKINEKRKIPIH